MSFWRGERILANLQSTTPIVTPSDKSLVDCNAYTLTLGEEVYVTPHNSISDPESHTKISLPQGGHHTIPAGQFALLLMEQKISIPDDAMAFISIKAKIKFQGLVNVSGFHVDPGYTGKLIFAVYNAGSSTITIERGQKFGLMWIAALDQSSKMLYAKKGIDVIDHEMINKINSELLTLQSLREKFDSDIIELKSEISEIRPLVNNLNFFLRGTFIAVVGAVLTAILIWIASLILDDFKWFFSREPMVQQETHAYSSDQGKGRLKSPKEISGDATTKSDGKTKIGDPTHELSTTPDKNSPQ